MKFLLKTIAILLPLLTISQSAIAQTITVRSNGTLSGTVQLPNKNPNFNNGTTRVDTDAQGRYFRNGVLVFSAENINPALVSIDPKTGKYYVDFRGIPVVSPDAQLISPDLQGTLVPTRRFNNNNTVNAWGNIQDELVLKGNFKGTVTDPATGKQYQGTFEFRGQGPRYSASNGGSSPTVFDFQSQYQGTAPKIPAKVTITRYTITAVPLSLSFTIPSSTLTTSNPTQNPTPPINPGSPIADLATPDSRFFEINRVVLDRQQSPIGPRSRVLLR